MAHARHATIWVAAAVFAACVVAAAVAVYFFGRRRERQEERERERERERLADAEPLLPASATPKTVYAAPDGGQPFAVLEMDGLLTPDQCDRIVAEALRKGLSDAETMDAENKATYTSYNPKFRTSRTVFLPDEALPEIELLARVTARIGGLPRRHQESLQVAQYLDGGEFKDHYDTCDEAEDACRKFNLGSGGRVGTLLVYLNDDFEGGETHFPHIDVTVTPKKGKAVYFTSTDGGGAIIHDSLHRANPVRGGEKWICTKWTHVKEYPA